MPSTRKYPTATASESPGNVAWTDPAHVEEDDTSYAECTLGMGEQTESLKCQDFFEAGDISGTILGIEVIVSRFSDDAMPGMEPVDLAIQLLGPDGNDKGDDKSAGASWPTSETETIFGGVADLWGTTWTPSDLMDPDFGVRIRAELQGGTGATCKIDTVEIRVTWALEDIDLDYTDGSPGNLVLASPGVEVQQPLVLGTTTFTLSPRRSDATVGATETPPPRATVVGSQASASGSAELTTDAAALDMAAHASIATPIDVEVDAGSATLGAAATVEPSASVAARGTLAVSGQPSPVSVDADLLTHAGCLVASPDSSIDVSGEVDLGQRSLVTGHLPIDVQPGIAIDESHRGLSLDTTGLAIVGESIVATSCWALAHGSPPTALDAGAVATLDAGGVTLAGSRSTIIAGIEAAAGRSSLVIGHVQPAVSPGLAMSAAASIAISGQPSVVGVDTLALLDPGCLTLCGDRSTIAIDEIFGPVGQDLSWQPVTVSPVIAVTSIMPGQVLAYGEATTTVDTVAELDAFCTLLAADVDAGLGRDVTLDSVPLALPVPAPIITAGATSDLRHSSFVTRHSAASALGHDITVDAGSLTLAGDVTTSPSAAVTMAAAIAVSGEAVPIVAGVEAAVGHSLLVAGHSLDVEVSIDATIDVHALNLVASPPTAIVDAIANVGSWPLELDHSGSAGIGRDVTSQAATMTASRQPSALTAATAFALGPSSFVLRQSAAASLGHDLATDAGPLTLTGDVRTSPSAAVTMTAALAIGSDAVRIVGGVESAAGPVGQDLSWQPVTISPEIAVSSQMPGQVLAYGEATTTVDTVAELRHSSFVLRHSAAAALGHNVTLDRVPLALPVPSAEIVVGVEPAAGHWSLVAGPLPATVEPTIAAGVAAHKMDRATPPVAAMVDAVTDVGIASLLLGHSPSVLGVGTEAGLTTSTLVLAHPPTRLGAVHIAAPDGVWEVSFRRLHYVVRAKRLHYG